MPQDTGEMKQPPADQERVTKARLAKSLLAQGKAKTKAQAQAMASLEIANQKAVQAKKKLKAIDEAQRRLEREQAKRERFSKSQKERRERTKLLIEAGGLVAKAGLLDWSPARLLGGLLTLAKTSENKFALWEAEGAKALISAPRKLPVLSGLTSPVPNAKQPPFGTPKTPMVAVVVETPQGRPPVEITTRLREMGLSWKSELQKWQGSIPAGNVGAEKSWVEGWGGVFIIAKE